MMVARISKDRKHIRDMFARISGRYDLLNHLLSLNIDRLWRRRLVRLLKPVPGERILDLCTGTGDMALELARSAAGAGRSERHREAPPTVILGTDFCPEMVHLGEKKRRRREPALGHNTTIGLGVADSLQLPFAEGSFDAVTVAFGIRNVVDLPVALTEMFRVLRPAGRVAVLEFTTPPRAWFRALFEIYFHRVLPWIGRQIAYSGSSSSQSAGSTGETDRFSGNAYSYLPASVKNFPDADALAELMSRAGFGTIRYRLLSLGIAAIHLGERP